MLKYLRFMVAFYLFAFNGFAHAAANQAPTVTLTAPAAGAGPVAPATITLTATAVDNDGTVSKVVFYQGTTLIGTSGNTTSPYSYTWTNVAAGSYALTAKATDNLGKVGTSANVNVTVGTATANPVVITSPATGAIVYGDNTSILGTFVGDPLSTTVWVDNGNTTRLALISGNTYSASLPIFPGTNLIKATSVKRDRTSAVASISVTGNQAPVITFSSPQNTSPGAPADITLKVDAFSPTGTISNVTFSNSGSVLGTLTAEPYQYTWNGVAKGLYTITAEATDNLGMKSSAQKALNVLGPNLPPTATLTSPLDGAVFQAPASIAITANASDPDGSITQVEFLRNGTSVGVSNVAPFMYSLNGVAVGAYSLAIRATDDRGAITTSAPVGVTVAPPNLPPSVSITGPSSGALFYVPDNVTLTANASDSDGQVAKVEFYQGTTLLGTSNASPYSFTWISPAGGSYALTAKAIDNFGSSTNSAPINITVSGPSVTYTGPGPSTNWVAPALISLSADATASNGATIVKVEFFAGANSIGTTSTAPYTFNWTNVDAGIYQISAKVTDSRGTVATSSVSTLNVAPAPFSASVSSPLNGSKFMVSNPVSVTLKAYSQTSTIAKLQLYDGTTLIESYVPAGNSNGLTYNTSWTPTLLGIHPLSLKVTDANGASITSTVVNLNIVTAQDLLTVEFSTVGKFYVQRGYIDLFANAAAPTGATLQRVEFLNGTTVIATMTTAPYNMTWAAGPGTYVLTAHTMNSLGNSTSSSPVTVSVREAAVVAVAAGIDGSTVNSRTIHIRGTVEAPPNSAVDANGKLGVIGSDGRYFINDVPLVAGSNAITIRVKTIDEQVATTNITVTSSGDEAFRFSADHATGIGSIEGKFLLTSPRGQVFDHAEVSCTDGAAVSAVVASAAELSQITCQYAVPGIHIAGIRVFDQNSTLLYSGTQTFYVASAPEIGRLVRGAFTGLMARLKDGNTQLAINSFLPSVQGQYNDMFIQLGAALPNAVASFGDISSVNFSDEMGELVLLRGAEGAKSAFMIGLILCDDGIWRVAAM